MSQTLDACGEAPLPPMDGSAFGRTRAALGLSQKAIGLALGVSSKAVESYEQGWRPVPDQVERKLYYLLFRLTLPAGVGIEPCWSTIGCTESARSACLAARTGEGIYCWFIAGKTCASAGAAGADPRYCYSCEVFMRLTALAGSIGRTRPA